MYTTPAHVVTSRSLVPEAIVERVLRGDDADVLGALNPDAVGGEHVLQLVEPLAVLARELVDVVHQTERHILITRYKPSIVGEV